MESSSHEEADTRMYLHVLDVLKRGYKDVCIRTFDTDVIIIGISLYHRLRAVLILKQLRKSNYTMVIYFIKYFVHLPVVVKGVFDTIHQPKKICHIFFAPTSIFELKMVYT